jgi:RNA polymerase sigma factor (TIGR02999 family)
MNVAMRDGQVEGFGNLLPLVYDELRHIARRELNARPSDTLCTTALVHELYLKLAGRERADALDRTHLLAVAAVAMRYILVDRARHRRAEKRGGARQRVTLDDGIGAMDDQVESLLELEDALERLGELDPRLVRVVEMRFFGGMSEQETAAVLGVTERTVRRDWVKARGLLYETLRR